MANIRAIANGNWSNAATWFGGVLPTSADDVFSNGFIVTIDGSFTVLSIRNTASTGIVAEGGFVFANLGSLTCTDTLYSQGGTNHLLVFSLSSGNSATLNSFVSGGNKTILHSGTGSFTINGNIQNYAASTWTTVEITGAGTLNIFGNLTQGSSVGSFASLPRTLLVTSPNTTIFVQGNIFGVLDGYNPPKTLGTIAIDTTANSTNLTVVGNVYAGNTTSFARGSTCAGISVNASSTINITGDLIGGNVVASPHNSVAIRVSATCALNVTGNIIAGSGFPAINANGSMTFTCVGNVTSNTNQPAIFNTGAPSSIDILGITTSGIGSAAVSGLTTTLVIVRGNVINTSTYAAIYAGRIVIDNNVTSWQFKDSTNTITRTLYAAGVALGNPATSNVRFGTTYGASLELTGTMRVPSAANVLQGVLVDNTVGTLLMTPAQCWNYLISSGFVANSIGERLQNASTVATTGAQIASYNI